MCGIAGFAGNFIPGLAKRMNSIQRHRGPDGSGVFEKPDQSVALTHVRLAILDLSPAALQPMISPDNRYVLVFNGEIYNFRELRSELQQEGIKFHSSGDTEVLLRGLERYGEAFIEKLNGMFAFALWDSVERELFLARDPIGIKPLYWAEPEPGTILFASEIKALFAHPALKRTPDLEVIQQHLLFCYATGDRTAFSGVRRLAPGSRLRWAARNRRHEVRTFRSADHTTNEKTYEHAVATLREKLHDAAARQLVTDVPLGAFLSGGLDSTLICALASKELKDPLSCYTITYPASENVLDKFEDDAPYAREIARSLGCRLHEIEIKPEVTSLLNRLVYQLDEPLADPAVIACFLVCELARRDGTKVLLSGQGADEFFGGYPRYLAINSTAMLDSLPNTVRKGISSFARRLPGALSGKAGASLRRVRRVLSAAELKPSARFLSYCAASPLEEVYAILSPDLKKRINTETIDDSIQILDDSTDGNRFLSRDINVYLPNHNLLYTDKMSMAAGVEARVPLIDLEVAKFVESLPYEWKVSGGRTKRILRDAAAGLVPQEIISRPKGGFGAPYRKWLRYDLVDMWEEFTSDRAIISRGWFDATALRQARERSQSGRIDLYMLQWAVLTIEIWARAFLDKNPTESPQEDIACIK